jgi:hypothetical protein
LDRRGAQCFIVKDATGQALGYFYFEDELGRRSGGEAAHSRRGAADGGELRYAARTTSQPSKVG